MSFFDAIKSGFVKYVDFTSRSSRSEYWYWVLFTIVAGMVLVAISSRLEMAFSLATLIPGAAVSARRLHDIGRSGWWLLIAFVPFVGWLVLLFWACQRGDADANRFGPSPLPALRRRSET